MEKEPVSLLIMAVLSFEGKENGVSPMSHAGGFEDLNFSHQIIGDPLGHSSPCL